MKASLPYTERFAAVDLVTKRVPVEERTWDSTASDLTFVVEACQAVYSQHRTHEPARVGSPDTGNHTAESSEACPASRAGDQHEVKRDHRRIRPAP